MASANGKAKPMMGPIKGMKRRIPARTPHTNELGIPMKNSPKPTTMPNAVLIASWPRKNRPQNGPCGIIDGSGLC